ncbi:hypothetical protein TWF281_005004 [Arthrobotrys megalospora]
MILLLRLPLSLAYILAIFNRSYAIPAPVSNVEVVNITAPNTGNISSANVAEAPSKLLPEPEKDWGLQVPTANLPLNSDSAELSPISDIQSRVDVPTNFFYAQGLHITCRPAEEFTSGRFKPVAFPGVTAIYVIDWLALTPEDLRREIKTLRRLQTRCKARCICNADGAIVGGGQLDSRGTDLCSDHFLYPEKCIGLYGCSCQAIMGQPQANIPGATIEDYRRALRQIPGHIQHANPDYVWTGAGVPLRFADPDPSDIWTGAGVPLRFADPDPSDIWTGAGVPLRFADPDPSDMTDEFLFYDGPTDEYRETPSNGHHHYYEPYKQRYNWPGWMYDHNWKHWGPPGGEGGGSGVTKRDSNTVNEDDG